MAVKNLSKGDYLNEANIICKGLEQNNSLEWDNIIGKKLIRDVKNDQLYLGMILRIINLFV